MADTGTEDGSGGTAGGRDGGSRAGLRLFTAEDGVDVLESGTMSFPAFDADDVRAIAAEGIDLTPAAIGNRDVVLFRGEGDDGFSLVRVWFAPHYVLPRHSHDADCLYYLLEGSIVMGSRRLEAGSGFFVPADAPYVYEAGPEGAVVLEFRQRTSFDMKIPGGQVARFRRMAEVGAANRERWAELREREVGRAAPRGTTG